MTIFEVMQQLADQAGSDIHIVIGSPITLRLSGELVELQQAGVVSQQMAADLILPLMSEEQREYVEQNKELDFGYQFQEAGRFRINVYHTKDGIAAALRLIPAKIKAIDELGLPPVLHEFTQYKQGLILVTGPTGEGKSTTLAAIIDEINAQRGEHILTIEDPIEFVYTPKKSIISQREIGQDTKDWSIALRSALREDPDIVLVGEMRDYETIASTLTIAETGHLVFATLHTASASETIDRIIDVFPGHQQGQVRQQLASSLKVVASQRLLPKVGGGRIAALEIMINNPAIRNLIREQKTHQINTIIQTSGDQGMRLIESNLAQLVRQGQITPEDARKTAFRPEEIERLLGSEVGVGSDVHESYSAHHRVQDAQSVLATEQPAAPVVAEPVDAMTQDMGQVSEAQAQAELLAAAQAVVPDQPADVQQPEASPTPVAAEPVQPQAEVQE